MADIANGKCHAKKAQEEPPLIQHGDLVLQAHHIGWIISGCFALVAITVSFWLISKHLKWYTNKHEQRYIVRILFLVPIYAIISFASYLFWNHSTPLLLLRDCYEATVLTAFFYLLLLYISPDPLEQKEIYRKEGLSRENDSEALQKGLPVRKWVFPLGFLKSKPADGLYFLQLMKWGILQYCVIRPLTTLAAIILDYIGLYCEDSWSPGWGHIYITVIVSLSVTVAMYCLIQVYAPVSPRLAPHQPLLKLFAIKAVVFLTFWQATGLSLLTLFGVVKDSQYMTADNINIGIGALLETFEMMIFALLHIRAFSYKPYVVPRHGTSQLRALMHVFDFRETLREVWSGAIYMVRHTRGLETDKQARREAAHDAVFSQARVRLLDPNSGIIVTQNRGRRENRGWEKEGVTVQVEQTVFVGGEQQWLGNGDDYAYGLGYHSRHLRGEKSEGLADQIETELAKRGYSNQSRYGLVRATTPRQSPVPDLDQQHRAWWRSIYDRISSSDYVAKDLETQMLTAAPERRSRSRHYSRDEASSIVRHINRHQYDDPPPPSVIRSYRNNRTGRQNSNAEIIPLVSSVRTHTDTNILQTELYQQSLSSPIIVPPSVGPTRRSSADSQVLTPSMTKSDRADSFLGRAFPVVSYASTSAEALTSGAASSHSHQSHVHFTAQPSVIVQGTDIAQSPMIVLNAHEEPPVLSMPRREADRVIKALSGTVRFSQSRRPKRSVPAKLQKDPTVLRSSRPSSGKPRTYGPTSSRLPTDSAVSHNTLKVSKPQPAASLPFTAAVNIPAAVNVSEQSAQVAIPDLAQTSQTAEFHPLSDNRSLHHTMMSRRPAPSPAFSLDSLGHRQGPPRSRGAKASGQTQTLHRSPHTALKRYSLTQNVQPEPSSTQPHANRRVSAPPASISAFDPSRNRRKLSQLTENMDRGPISLR